MRGGISALSQCTFWCSVLSDRATTQTDRSRLFRSQCTFWCSVLSDRGQADALEHAVSYVSMHLLVLSAFRLSAFSFEKASTPQVSMHLLVLSAFRRTTTQRPSKPGTVSMHLLVLSAFRRDDRKRAVLAPTVSMHLLVLSAFRLRRTGRTSVPTPRLNAPFGAQCFPTMSSDVPPLRTTRLNAPFGAQCFPTILPPQRGTQC